VQDEKEKKTLTADVGNRFNIYTTFLQDGGQSWVRISVMVYNTIEDYEKLADAILTLKAEEAGE